MGRGGGWKASGREQAPAAGLPGCTHRTHCTRCSHYTRCSSIARPPPDIDIPPPPVLFPPAAPRGALPPGPVTTTSPPRQPPSPAAAPRAQLFTCVCPYNTQHSGIPQLGPFALHTQRSQVPGRGNVSCTPGTQPVVRTPRKTAHQAWLRGPETAPYALNKENKS